MGWGTFVPLPSFFVLSTTFVEYPLPYVFDMKKISEQNKCIHYLNQI